MFGSLDECVNCQANLENVPYVSAWESGDNPRGYKDCPECGYRNEDYADDDD